MNRFIDINDSFKCHHCGTENPQHPTSCRNHCKNCLYSLHLDLENPGDRLSDCLALMQPFKIDQNGKKGWMIYHKCTKCGKIIPNKAAPDDNLDELIKLSQNEQPRSQKTRR